MVRVVGPEHEVVLTVHGCGEDASSVILEAEDDVVAEILAGQPLIEVPFGVVEAPPRQRVVEPLQQARHPSGT